MPSKENFVEVSMYNIVCASKEAGQELEGFTCTAIYCELNKMFAVGASQAVETGALTLKPITWEPGVWGNFTGSVNGLVLFRIGETSFPPTESIGMYKLGSTIPGYNTTYHDSVEACKEKADSVYAAFVSQFLNMKE